MGGPASRYYDRDVTPKSSRTSRGATRDAEEALSANRADKALLAKDRRLVCEAENPVFYSLDVTGSMGNLPRIIWDKMPMIAGQIVEKRYLDDPMVALAGVGDVLYDQAPIQIADFSFIRNLDSWLKRIWLEGKGGGNGQESYEMLAYFGARMIDMPKAKKPFFLFTGDEGFQEVLPSADLNQHFGGNHREVSASKIFAELREKFKDNVFLIHRQYGPTASRVDEAIVAQWTKVLGKERVILLGEDLAIADITLGLFAVMGGNSSLAEYLEDMKTRGQSKERIAMVERSLAVLAPIAPKPSRKGKVAVSVPDEDTEKKSRTGKKPAKKEDGNKVGSKAPGGRKNWKL